MTGIQASQEGGFLAWTENPLQGNQEDSFGCSWSQSLGKPTVCPLFVASLAQHQVCESLAQDGALGLSPGSLHSIGLGLHLEQGPGLMLSCLCAEQVGGRERQAEILCWEHRIPPLLRGGSQSSAPANCHLEKKYSLGCQIFPIFTRSQKSGFLCEIA